MTKANETGIFKLPSVTPYQGFDQVRDQVRAIQTAPACHQVVSGHRRILAVAAGGDVIEIAGVLRSHANLIEGRIEKPNRRIWNRCALHSLLVHQSYEPRPLRSGVAGSTITPAARAVITAILVGVRLRSDIWDVPQRRRSAIGEVDDARELLIRGNCNLVL